MPNNFYSTKRSRSVNESYLTKKGEKSYLGAYVVTKFLGKLNQNYAENFSPAEDFFSLWSH